jgi:uncharacterized membrane protein
MVIGAMQCFMIILVITSVIGLTRGFLREVITMAIVLAAVVFLVNGGDGLMHQFFFVNLPQAFHDLIYGSNGVTVGEPTVTTTTNTTGEYLFSLASFVGLICLGYGVGHRYGGAPKTNMHRLGGILPGLVNGAAVSYYASKTIFPATQVDLTSPSSALTQAYLPVVLGLGLVALVTVLVVSSLSSRKGGGH